MIDLGRINVPCPACGRDIPVTGRISGDTERGWTVSVQVDQERLAETIAAHKAEHHPEENAS